jgi:hypothetical protein
VEAEAASCGEPRESAELCCLDETLKHRENNENVEDCEMDDSIDIV